MKKEGIQSLRKGKGGFILVDNIEFKKTIEFELFEILLMKFPAGLSFKKTHSHAGEELHYVLEGELDYFIEDEMVKLYPGDIIWHPSNLLHSALNSGKKPAYTIHAVCPPTFSRPELTNDFVPPCPVPKIENWEKPYVVVRKNEALATIEVYGVRNIAKMVAPRIIAYLLDFPPQSSVGEEYSHEGYEAHYILEGKLEHHLNKEKSIFEKGDFLAFFSKNRHTFINPYKERAKMFSLDFIADYWIPTKPKIVKIKE
ncbi:MAG: cupin domain-containing protein [Candidatus Aminicenantia bacterium]